MYILATTKAPKAKPRRESMLRPDPRFFGNNVYILGAGFSAHAGMPVMSNFMTRMRDVRELSSDLPPEAARAIDLVLEERARLSGVRDKIKLNLDNVEDLFSLIDARATSERGNKSRRLTTSVRKAISATLLNSKERVVPVRMSIRSRVDAKLVRERVSLRPDAGIAGDDGHIEADPYRLFSALLLHRLDAEADILTATDTVITFNYDLVLEDNLGCFSVRPDYCLDEKSYSKATRPTPNAPKVIKVHGSVNWEDKGRLGVNVVHDAGQVLASEDGRAFLIPPTWAKGTQTRLSRLLWSNAVDAIQKAHRIVIIGYSMPQTDLYFKYLLAAGLRDNSSLRRLTIINPSSLDEAFSEILDETYFEHRLFPVHEHFETVVSSAERVTGCFGRGRALVEKLPGLDSMG